MVPAEEFWKIVRQERERSLLVEKAGSDCLSAGRWTVNGNWRAAGNSLGPGTRDDAGNNGDPENGSAWLAGEETLFPAAHARSAGKRSAHFTGYGRRFHSERYALPASFIRSEEHT